MSNETLNYSLSNNAVLISNTVRFWIYLLFLFPSIICSFFVLYYLLCYRLLRHGLHNHAIIVFLIIGLIYELTIYPWMLYFYQHEGIWERAHLFCTFWVYIDWGLYYTQTILFAWATIERHILIFHHQWLGTRKKRLLIHYLPLTVLILYCLIYYITTMFFPSCEHEFDNRDIICVDPCSFHSTALYFYETLIHQLLPNLVIVIFSITLFLRIRRQKNRIGTSLQWRKHWKMTVQVLFVAVIYLLFALPVTLMNFLHLFRVPLDATVGVTEYFLFLNYWMILLCPFACAFALPQLRNKIKNICFSPHQMGIVVPII